MVNEMDIFQVIRRGTVAEFKDAMAGVNLNVEDSSGQNLLHHAIAHGMTEVALHVLKGGIDVNYQDSNGQTPLHYCAVHSNHDVAEQILKWGGEVNLVDKHGNGPLWTAVFNARGVYALVNLFIQYGAKADMKNKNGKSPRDFAQQIGDDALLKMLKD